MTYDINASIEERRAAKFNMGAEKEAAGRTAKNEIQVLIPGHFIDVEDLPKNIKAIADQLPGVMARHARTFEEGAVFKSGARAGEKRPDKTLDHYSIGLRGRHPLTAAWSDGKMLYAKGYRNGELFWTESVNELKARVKGWFENDEV
jgi:hypothetical protein